MRGWEVLGEAHQERSDYANFKHAALDKVVEAGINRIRLEVRSGVENPIDAFGVWQAAGYPNPPDPAYAQWRAKRYETINDNSDPNTINPAGYHFTELDWAVDAIVNPLRAKLAAKGEALFVNLNYVAFLAQVTSGVPYVHETPAEYAEFTLAAFDHLQQRYGWTPDAIEIILEPDNVLPTWTPTLIGQVIAATGSTLAARGYRPEIIAGSTTCMSAAVSYFDGIVAVPGALPYLKEFSYHRYCGTSLSSLQTIAARAANVGIATSMLEWWDANNTFETLHEDLKFGRNGAWQEGAIVDVQSNSTVGTIAQLNPEVPAVASFTNPTQFFRRYFEHVRMGAVRVDTTSSSSETDGLAFRNLNGAFTVVVKAAAGGAIAVAGLPAGTYGIDYTASSVGSADTPDRIGRQPDQTIAAGQTLTTDLPAWGVITIYGKSASAEICGDLKDNDGDGLIDEDCLPSGPTTPGAPSGLTADAAGSTLTVRWDAPIAGGPVAHYVLDAGLTPGATLVSLPLGAGTTGELPGVPAGTYLLRVRAIGGGSTSAASNEVAVTVGGCAAAPHAPTALAARVNGPMVSLTWNDDQGLRRPPLPAGGRLHEGRVRRGRVPAGRVALCRGHSRRGILRASGHGKRGRRQRAVERGGAEEQRRVSGTSLRHRPDGGGYGRDARAAVVSGRCRRRAGGRCRDAAVVRHRGRARTRRLRPRRDPRGPHHEPDGSGAGRSLPPARARDGRLRAGLAVERVGGHRALIHKPGGQRADPRHATKVAS